MESTSLIPSKFNGTGDVDSWIYSFENYCHYKNESDQRRCALLPLLLTEQAFDWYQILEPAKKIHYPHLRAALKERFGNSPIIRHKTARELFERKQGDESVDTYVAKMLKLASSLGSNREQLCLYATLSGLKPHIASYVAQNKPTTIQDLLELGRVAEMTMVERTDEPVLIKAVADLKSEIAKLGTSIQSTTNIGETFFQNTVCPVNPRYENNQDDREPVRQRPTVYNQEPSRRQQWNDGPQRQHYGQDSDRSTCSRCGLFHSNPQTCRALGATCYHCFKLHHFRAKCRTAMRSQMSTNQGQGPERERDQMNQH